MESTLNVLDGIRDIEKAIGPDVSALETRAKTSISDKLAVGLVLEQTKGILNALSNDIKAKTNIVPENVITQTAKEVENMIVPGGISPLTPETMTASTVGGINDLAVRRNRAALSKVGQPTRREGVTGLPTNLNNMATGARGGIVAFAEGELVEEDKDEAEDIKSQLAPQVDKMKTNLSSQITPPSAASSAGGVSPLGTNPIVNPNPTTQALAQSLQGKI